MVANPPAPQPHPQYFFQLVQFRFTQLGFTHLKKKHWHESKFGFDAFTNIFHFPAMCLDRLLPKSWSFNFPFCGCKDFLTLCRECESHFLMRMWDPFAAPLTHSGFPSAKVSHSDIILLHTVTLHITGAHEHCDSRLGECFYYCFQFGSLKQWSLAASGSYFDFVFY